MIGYYIWAVYHPNYGLQPGPIASHTPDGIDPGAYSVDLPELPPHRDLSDQEKVALLSIAVDNSNSDESNYHVAEVSSVMPGEADFTGDSSQGSGSNANSTGVP